MTINKIIIILKQYLTSLATMLFLTDVFQDGINYGVVRHLDLSFVISDILSIIYCIT